MKYQQKYIFWKSGNGTPQKFYYYSNFQNFLPPYGGQKLNLIFFNAGYPDGILLKLQIPQKRITKNSFVHSFRPAYIILLFFCKLLHILNSSLWRDHSSSSCMYILLSLTSGIMIWVSCQTLAEINVTLVTLLYYWP